MDGWIYCIYTAFFSANCFFFFKKLQVIRNHNKIGTGRKQKPWNLIIIFFFPFPREKEQPPLTAAPIAALSLSIRITAEGGGEGRGRTGGDGGRDKRVFP